ncbi:hypothetical protein V6N11_063162 [Hibiscus sabdariffa]|uniref:DUF4219 domain-containing protein n=1 Tax=Hibiscus sabdariffa TaxID=183260 RepID=A0ABR1Z8M5_9ROSI
MRSKDKSDPGTLALNHQDALNFTIAYNTALTKINLPPKESKDDFQFASLDASFLITGSHKATKFRLAPSGKPKYSEGKSKVRYQLGVNNNMGTNSSSSSQLPIPLFNGEKYQFWGVKMQTLFKSQDLWELVEEGIPETDDAAKTKENKKKDAKALYLLQQAIHDDIFPTILSASSSREAWLTLQQEY